jgi:hypothetical protein
MSHVGRGFQYQHAREYITVAPSRASPNFNKLESQQARVRKLVLFYHIPLDASMAPIGEAYFPPLDRCFSGEYQLLYVCNPSFSESETDGALVHGRVLM